MFYGAYESVLGCGKYHGEFLRFLFDSFFFLPHSLVIFFWFVEAVKELRTEEKR